MENSREKQIEEMPERNVKMFSSKEEYEHYRIKLIKREVAEEIFAEIEDLTIQHAQGDLNDKYFYLAIDELKKKYIGKDTNVTTNTEEGK